MSTTDCFLCEIPQSTPAKLPRYDQPLAALPGIGYAIPALGALAPGHLLVVPEQHWFSSSSISVSATEFALFTLEVLGRVESHYGPATIFEHGACALQIRRSACVAHAHLQILPGKYALHTVADTVPRASFRSIAEFIGSGVEQQGYLMYQEPGDSVSYIPDPAVSQLVRRHVAAQVGRPTEWDYLLFQNHDTIADTIRNLSSLKNVRVG